MCYFNSVYTDQQLTQYKEQLKTIASFSRLFSESATPLIHYRSTEFIYCACFGARNVARDDATIDAVYNSDDAEGIIGVGIKTFEEKNNGSNQKIAEFDKAITSWGNLRGRRLVREIATYRNDRIETAKATYGLGGIIYHCILRNRDGVIKVYEEDMFPINFENVRIIKDTKAKCVFEDEHAEYTFYRSKSTLTKRFDFRGEQPLLSFEIRMIENPMNALNKLIERLNNEDYHIESRQEIVLPLYSFKGKERYVYPKSGLNLWNAGGRERNLNEIEIRVPRNMRVTVREFLGEIDEPWQLHLPNGQDTVLNMKVCQENGKAIMSNPNEALGRWILRYALQIEAGHVMTYEDLLQKGVNALVLRKRDDGSFECDFTDDTEAYE